MEIPEAAVNLWEVDYDSTEEKIMVSYIQAGALGVAGASWTGFKILIAGLYLAGAFTISSPTEVGVSAVAQYSDLELDSVGITIPMPVNEIKSLKASWIIYDFESGDEINRDSIMMASVKKNEAFFIDKTTTLSMPVSEIDRVIVELTVSGRIAGGMLPISKTETFEISTSQLTQGFKFDL